MSNILVDTSGNGNNGTINGAVSTKNGMAFDGVKSNIVLDDNGDLNPIGDFTWMFRYKPIEITGGVNRRILSNSIGSNGFELYSDHLTFRVYTAGSHETKQLISTQFELNQFCTVLITKSGNTYTAWINGISETPVVFSNPIISLSNNLYIGSTIVNSWFHNMEMNSLRMMDRVATEIEIKNYHNQFVKPVIIEDFQNKPVDKFPREWIEDSGAFLVSENISGNKYLECTGNGIAKFLYKDTLSGTASIDYYDGATLVTVTDVLSTLISTYAWLSHDGQYLEFTLTNGDYIDNILITNGIKQ